MDESSIPIDIQTNKLLEWLISRRHVNKDWQNNILKIREKINNAIQDMPAHEGIVKLLSGQHINYFHCLTIIDILKETEADSKNLFGRYGSQRMKDWQDIVSSYQRDNIYLAEAAQIMMRNVSYEVPSLKKQIAKSDQIRQECEKKMKDYNRAENIAQNDFNALCKQLGISGKKIKVELIELLNEIPIIYKKCAENAKSLKTAVDLYNAFVNFHMGKSNADQALGILTYLITNGNTSTYEYTYGEKPIGIEEPALNIVDDVDDEAAINFGDDEIQIDFGDITVENNDIDFNCKADIDWGNVTPEEEFEIVDMDINLEESGIVVEKSGLDGGIAKGNEAYTILDNPKTRNQILNDLMELEAFLKMRLYEMAGAGDLLLQLDCPTIVQMQTIESITAMSDFVRITLNDLTNKRISHLHNIKHSPKYVDILTGSLKQKLEVVDRMVASKKVLTEKIEDATKEARTINPVIKKVIQQTKNLQGQIQSDISTKYKGRPVNIVGGVNMM